jgi:hypothetical protein
VSQCREHLLALDHGGFVPLREGIEFLHRVVDLGVGADLGSFGEGPGQEELGLSIDVALLRIGAVAEGGVDSLLDENEIAQSIGDVWVFEGAELGRRFLAGPLRKDVLDLDPPSRVSAQPLGSLGLAVGFELDLLSQFRQDVPT